MSFTFIDLFAGIGGFHLAMSRLGGKCVFASEKDKYARKTYEHNFKKIDNQLFAEGHFNDDIRNVVPSEVPDFDILCAGFPCQPFSQAGYKLGFDDTRNSERGNLFFNIAEIIATKRPKAFFLENVRGIIKHDNGKTFSTIQKILQDELGYSFYYKIVKASDYGLPQLRPRAFIIGFRDEGILKGFTFPPTVPLKYNMSDVWGGNCSREIGYTLRVGGRGSKINDRHNWDAYLVDGVVKQLSIEEGKKMQGFPSNFEFPVSKTQAIKQLGNSVAVDAIQMVGKQVVRYLQVLEKNTNQIMKEKKRKNKGEWTEFLLFLKLLVDQKLYLLDKQLELKEDYFNIHKITTQNSKIDVCIIDNEYIEVKSSKTEEIKKIAISTLLATSSYDDLVDLVKSGKGRTFEVPLLTEIQKKIGIEAIKGGTSNQKADIELDISNADFKKEKEGFGIKSYLGSKPTLLNASGNTNFVFEVSGLKKESITTINAIKTRTKLLDRLEEIEKKGGELLYKEAERKTMDYNLKLVDSQMPLIIGHILMTFYKERISSIKDIIDFLDEKGTLKKLIGYSDKDSLIIKVKKLLLDILLGMFAGTKWDGNYESNGTIVMKKTGEIGGFYITDMSTIKDYLYNHIKLDTPSLTRHRFGSLYQDDGKMYMKLNLQLRFM